MIRRTMPRLTQREVLDVLGCLRVAENGRKFNNIGEVGTMLAGYKPAVTVSLPEAPAVGAVETLLSSFGFRYSSQSEILRVANEPPLPIRSGLIWSVPTALELYGGTEQEMHDQIRVLLRPQNCGNLPGHLLGYADNSLDPSAHKVTVRLHFWNDPGPHLPLHFSRARDPQEAEELAGYYKQAGREVVDALELPAMIEAEVQ